MTKTTARRATERTDRVRHPFGLCCLNAMVVRSMWTAHAEEVGVDPEVMWNGIVAPLTGVAWPPTRTRVTVDERGFLGSLPMGARSRFVPPASQ